jgi:hypothetical protein
VTLTSKVVFLNGVFFAWQAAYGLPLTPGGSVTPTVAPTSSVPTGAPNGVSSQGFTPFFQEDASWSVNSQPAKAGMNFDSAVYKDTSTGGLDFFYQIQNPFKGAATGTNTVASSFVIDWFTLPGITITGVDQIDASDFTGPFSNFLKPKPAGSAITNVSLNGSDNMLTVTLDQPIKPGQNSAILVVQTNAHDFDQASNATFNWVTNPTGAGVHGAVNPFNLQTLEPVITTPEPGFYGLLALAIAGTVMIARGRSSKLLKKA